MGPLGLVVKAICLWNTKHMDLALQHLQDSGMTILKEDVERLSPFVHEHINLMGRYHFEVPEVVKQGLLRSLVIVEVEDFE